MDDIVISEKEYSDYLKDRDKALTPNQIRQLREIDRAAFFLSYYPELGEEVIENTARVLRNRQREILLSERKTTGEKITSLVPEQVKVVLQENNIL